MKRYKWELFDKATGEKLDSGWAWADNLKNLTETEIAPVLRHFYKTPDEVRLSAVEVKSRKA